MSMCVTVPCSFLLLIFAWWTIKQVEEIPQTYRRDLRHINRPEQEFSNQSWMPFSTANFVYLPHLTHMIWLISCVALGDLQDRFETPRIS